MAVPPVATENQLMVPVFEVAFRVTIPASHRETAGAAIVGVAFTVATTAERDEIHPPLFASA